MTVVLTGTTLALEDVVRVAREGEQVEIAKDALVRMRASRDVVEGALARGEQVYGFSTGVGMRKLFSIEDDQAQFNALLVRGHLVAQGPAAPNDVVRATLLKLANMLAGGMSGGKSPATVESSAGSAPLYPSETVQANTRQFLPTRKLTFTALA